MGKLYAACSTLVRPRSGGRLHAVRRTRTLEMAAEILYSRTKFFLPGEDLEQTQEFDRESFIDAVQTLKDEIISG